MITEETFYEIIERIAKGESVKAIYKTNIYPGNPRAFWHFVDTNIKYRHELDNALTTGQAVKDRILYHEFKEHLDDVSEGLAEGYNTRTIFKKLGVHPSTFYRYINKYPEFQKQLTLALEVAAHHHNESSHEVLLEEPKILEQTGAIDAAWVRLASLKSASHARLARIYNNKYNDRTERNDKEDSSIEIKL